MNCNHNMYRGKRSADNEVPTIDWQTTCETWKAAHEKVDRIADELQDTVHKQAREIERLRAEVKDRNEFIALLQNELRNYRERKKCAKVCEDEYI